MEFRKITVSGTPFEMGYAFAKACEEEIRSLLLDVLSDSAEEN